MKKIVYYVNQFYGQIGGEEAADQTPIVKEVSDQLLQCRRH